VAPLKVRAIIIDMDGTITNFNLDFMDVRRKGLKELERMNLRTPDMTEQTSFFVLLNAVKDRLDALSYVLLRRKFYNLLEEMELEGAKGVTLYSGAVETLQKIRSHGVKIGLVTNNGRAGTDLTLNRLGLQSFFDVVVTRDDCEEMKPSAEPVKKALAGMHVQIQSAILVGDGVMDVLAARATGLLSIAVATGPFSNERLLKVEPDYFLGSINDLPLLIDSLETKN
jgi:HAD superfamily hydrolase (TIGR01549 family)